MWRLLFKELPEERFEFPFILIGFFNRPIMTQWSNLGTQVGAHNRDFGALLQTDLTRVKTFRLRCRLGKSLCFGSVVAHGGSTV